MCIPFGYFTTMVRFPTVAARNVKLVDFAFFFSIYG